MSLHGAVRIPHNDIVPPDTPPSARRISVIVPTRNRPALLARALGRIRSQAYEAFEVLVVDDGSSAATRAAYDGIWRELDGRFRRIELGSPDAPGLGPSVTRNTGIDAARGDIVTFCDDDDVWTDERHLDMMARVFDADPQVDLYIGNQCAVRCDGTVERANWLPVLLERVRSKPRSQPDGVRVSVGDLIGAGGFAQLNVVAVRKATAVAIGGFWTHTSYEEDRDFFWRAVDAAGAVFFNPRVVAQHNVPDPGLRDNLSRSYSQTERWMISAMVSQHISMTVRSAPIRSMCQVYEGDILRYLARYLLENGQHALGLQYARRALAARISLKWALYTGALMCRQMMRKEVA